MEYDPIKFRLAKALGTSPKLRKCFHILLETIFLRAWYIRKALWGLVSRLGSTPRVLDAGMGFGQYSDLMHSVLKSPKITGLEIDRKHFYDADRYFKKSRKQLDFTIGDVQELPFAESSFDLILSVDVMEHIEDDQATFHEFSRVLRRGGVFLMHTPRITPGSETDHHDHEHTGMPNDQWSVDEHYRDGYRDYEAVERLEKAGFRIMQINHGYGLFGMIAWQLMQRIPMSMLDHGKLWIIPVAIYLIFAIPLAIIAMLLDLCPGDQPLGGSLMILAEKK